MHSMEPTLMGTGYLDQAASRGDTLHRIGCGLPSLGPRPACSF